VSIEFLNNRYQVYDQIGRDLTATIYRARDRQTGRIVAIKVLHEHYSADPKFVARFQREAKAQAALQHPGIVQVYDFGNAGAMHFIVMELVEGTDLRRYLRARGVIEVEMAVRIAHNVADALGAAHGRNIVHRNVMPQNIRIGGGREIKLTGFSIAVVYKDTDTERLSMTGTDLGMVQYYAPEQVQGEMVGPTADVYALGIVLYEMLTGRPPFDGDTPVAVAMQHIQDQPTPPAQLNPNIPPDLDALILRCLEKEAEKRYQDGNELVHALEMVGKEA